MPWRPNRKASNSHCTRIKPKPSNVAYKLLHDLTLPTSTVEVLIIQLEKNKSMMIKFLYQKKRM